MYLGLNTVVRQLLGVNADIGYYVEAVVQFYWAATTKLDEENPDLLPYVINYVEKIGNIFVFCL